MITKIIYTAGLALFAISGLAQPAMEFETKKVDFGTIIEGTINTYRFKYKNTGNQPLIIEHVSVTCGCTAPQWSKVPLPPGDTASLYIEFNSANKMGPVTKGVNVMTNCPEPLIGLLVYANIISDPNFIPTIDSISHKPLKSVFQKSFNQVQLPMKSIVKKGFKGTESDAEKMIKEIMKQTNPLLYNNVWITTENGMLIANMLDKNLQAPTILLIEKEMLKKKRLKYWIKKMKA